MIDNKLIEDTKYLFDRSFEDDLSNDEEDALIERADSIISSYDWRDTFAAWSQYLHENCTTPESVINFANLFWWYGGQDHAIPDPYDFLGYLYYRVNLEPEKYGGADILDSIATSTLKRSGFREADLELHPDYMPENDPKLLEAVEKIRQQFS